MKSIFPRSTQHATSNMEQHELKIASRTSFNFPIENNILVLVHLLLVHNTAYAFMGGSCVGNGGTCPPSDFWRLM